MADTYLALAALLAAEFAFVAAAQRREFAGPYEIGFAAAWVLPLALLLAAPLSLIAAALFALVRRAEAPLGRALAALTAGAFGGAVALGVSDGRHLDGGGRAPFVAVIALVGAASAWMLAPRVARRIAGQSRRENLLSVLGLFAAIVVVEIVNDRVLPRLYLPFHHGLAALALLAAPFAAHFALSARGAAGAERSRESVVRIASALALFALSAAMAPSAAESLAPADNIRRVYATHAPLLGYAIEAGAAMTPPPPLDDDQLPEATAGGERTVDFTGRDFVLVTIDALRADHVGAYGYERDTTPSLDRLAEEGVVFEAAYTQAPHTSYAVTSLMTGKYMRPLLLQGLGEDAETFASHLRRYGYKTGAFYPPAVFFIDPDRFAGFRDRGLDFEYKRVEFATAAERATQVRAYLGSVAETDRVFLWVHLFEPHEPYEAHADHAFGDRDIDRYDGEIASADAGLGAIVEAVRAARPGAIVMVAADHGEEFLDHGSRYHGTTVYEEQTRIPLVFNAKGLLTPRRVTAPVQLIDLLPTVLAGLDIPRPARVRGVDLGPYLAGAPLDDSRKRGFAFAESESQTLLARDALRLVCERRIGACALYDVARDPGETRDVASDHPAELAAMRAELRTLEASHGRYETRGLHDEGKGFPEALRRGIAGDADAAGDVAALLDDADVSIRRKAAEVLFELKRPETAESLRLSLLRDEDDEVRRYAALALTRLGQGAPLVRELVLDRDKAWSRLAALALAESGDARGERILVAWWRAAYPAPDDDDHPAPVPIPFERAKEIAAALGRIRSRNAVRPLIDALSDVRLRPFVAAALAAIDEEAARPALAKQLETERYHTARVAIVDALVKLGAKPELRLPLIFLLGTPDPLPGGLDVAMKTDLLQMVGGPRKRDLTRLRRFATSGIAIGLTVPKGGSGKGVRLICRARSTDDRPGELRVGIRAGQGGGARENDGAFLVPADAPRIDPARSMAIPVPQATEFSQVFGTFPEAMSLHPGGHRELVFYATQNVEVDVCAAVPLSDELPPPPPEPWAPEADAGP